MVLIAHTAHIYNFDHPLGLPLPWIGRLGVALFFVHTSCVLMMSLARNERVGANASTSTIVFFVRRAFRIYPFYFVSLGAVAFLDIRFRRFVPPYELNAAGWSANALLIQNVTYSPDAIFVAWSLPIEMQMYLLLPLLYFSVVKFGRVDLLICAWLISLPLAFLPPMLSMRLSLLRYIPNFLPGLIAYVLFSRVKPRLKSGLLLLLIPAVSLTYLMAGRFSHQLMPHSIYWSWPICLVVGSALPYIKEFPKGAITGAAKYVARYSYGLYLSHPILLHFLKPRTQPNWAIALYLLALCICAAAAYHFVEQPMVRLGARISRSRQVVVGATA